MFTLFQSPRELSSLTMALLLLLSCTPASQPQDDPGPSLKLLTHNVWVGFEPVPERKALWLDWMKAQNPDIVCLQELNHYTPEQLAEDAAYWGHEHVALLKEEGFPTGITSRYPMEDVQRRLEGFHHGLMRVNIQGLYLYNVHLHPGNWAVRHREVEQILADMADLPADAPVMLAGDFNALSPHDASYYAHGLLEPFFDSLDQVRETARNLREGALDYGAMEKLEAAGLTDVEFEARTADYVFPGTFPTLIEKPGYHGKQRRLDYVWVNAALRDAVQGVHILADDTAQILSDHLPVVVKVEWKGGN